MNEPIKITFFVSNRPHCLTAKYIINNFYNNNFSVDINIIIQDKYKNTNCRDFCIEYGYSFENLPRIDGGDKSLWNTKYCIEKNLKVIIGFYKNYILKFKPEVVVIVPYENGPFEVELIKTCKSFGIKTLLLQEGLIITDDNKEACLFNKPPNYFLLNPEEVRIKSSFIEVWPSIRVKLSNVRNPKALLKKLYKNIFLAKLPECRPFGLNGVDYVGTLSNYYSNKLIERGLSPQQLRPVGLARFDEIGEYMGKIYYKTSLKNKSTKIVILYPQEWGFEFGIPKSHISSVESEISRLKNLAESFRGRVIIKYRLRQGESIDRYRILITGMNDKIIIEEGRQVPSYHSIMESDVVITMGSTMLLEALALGKIGILFDTSQKDYYGYIRDGGCLMAYNDTHLVSVIEKILRNPELSAEMRQKASKFVVDRAMIDGKASERTCQFIKDIVSGKRINVDKIFKGKRS